jgi:hypothetical protein
VPSGQRRRHGATGNVAFGRYKHEASRHHHAAQYARAHALAVAAAAEPVRRIRNLGGGSITFYNNGCVL